MAAVTTTAIPAVNMIFFMASPLSAVHALLLADEQHFDPEAMGNRHFDDCFASYWLAAGKSYAGKSSAAEPARDAGVRGRVAAETQTQERRQRGP